MRLLFFPAAIFLSGCLGPGAPESFTDARWHRQQVDSTVRFQAVSAPTDDVVWVSGTEGTFARTVDGGLTWQVGHVPGAETLEFRDVHGITASEAFLMSAGSGGDSRIYRTRDAGVTWREVFRNDEPEGFFDCFSFWDAERGIAFSDEPDGDFLVMRTMDGGDSWARVDRDALDDAHDGEGAFAASGTCLLTASDGRAWFGTGASAVDSRVFRTSDYGESWQSVVVESVPSMTGTSGIFTLAFLDHDTGLAMGGDFSRADSLYGHTARTEDGGESWSPAGDTGLGGSVYGSSFVPGAPTQTVIAVAPTGSAWSVDGGASWRLIDSENYWAVGASSGGGVWAVGPGGRIAHLEVSRPPTS